MQGRKACQVCGRALLLKEKQYRFERNRPAFIYRVGGDGNSSLRHSLMNLRDVVHTEERRSVVDSLSDELDPDSRDWVRELNQLISH